VNDLRAIAAGAGEKSLPFLLAGGHAVIAHGHARTTFDLDLMIRRDDREKWVSLAHELGYTTLREGPTFVQFNAESSASQPLDLMLVNDETFRKLLEDSVPGPPSISGVKLVSLRHLLALKCHAIKHGHPGRIVKDADDVIHLVEANGLDMSAPDIRELFMKHGTEELYEKVRRISRTA
jgi:hypothetical protein